MPIFSGLIWVLTYQEYCGLSTVQRNSQNRLNSWKSDWEMSGVCQWICLFFHSVDHDSSQNSSNSGSATANGNAAAASGTGGSNEVYQFINEKAKVIGSLTTLILYIFPFWMDLIFWYFLVALHLCKIFSIGQQAVATSWLCKSEMNVFSQSQFGSSLRNNLKKADQNNLEINCNYVHYHRS